MLKRLISAYVASRALAQDMPPPAGSCPQFCFVNTTGPQFSSTQFQGPVFYKNKGYMATIAPYQYLMLADSVSSSGRPNIYNFDKWILSEQVLVGQTYSSSTETIMVGFECYPDGKAFANITNPCMDTIMYMSPEFCTTDFMAATHRPDLVCPMRETSTTSPSPTRQAQPGSGGAIQTSMSPTSTSVNRDTVSLSATMTSMPTRQMQYSMSPTGSSKTNSAASMTSEPTKREEPSMSSAPTRQVEPSMTSEPTKREEPSMSSEPTKREEPSMSSEPTKREEPSMSSAPTKREEPSMSSAPTRQVEPSMSSAPTKREEPSITSEPTKREEPSMSSEPTKHEEPSMPPMDDTCDEAHPCIRIDVAGPNLTINEPIITGLLTDSATPQFIIYVSSNLTIKSNVSRTFEFSGWVIVDGLFVGQRFTAIEQISSRQIEAEHKFIQFNCAQRNFIGLVPVHDPCVPRLALMHPAFCADMTTDVQCMAHNETTRPTAEPTTRPTPTTEPTSRPTQSAQPTRRPDAPSDKPTSRPTYSALPTRRPTPSTMPTRMFRSPPPVEMAKTLRSQIRIETRNESLFQNPKNVEAVVKTVVCTLNVPSDTVQVSGIQHFVDNILIGTIPVPQINRSRNFTDECIKEQQPRQIIIPNPTPIPPIEPQAMRRLQSGLDTYVVQYQVQDPPASVTALEPATVATMMQTAPTLVNSLDIPTGSYVAITAEQPIYTQAQQAQQQVQQTDNNVVNNTLMGVFIPIGIVAIGSIIAMTIKKRATANTRPIRVTTIMNQQPQAQAFVQTNPSTRIVRIPSRSTMQPMKIRNP